MRRRRFGQHPPNPNVRIRTVLWSAPFFTLKPVTTRMNSRRSLAGAHSLLFFSGSLISCL